MKIDNYDNRSRAIDLARLRDEGRSEDFIRGVRDAIYDQTSQHPPKPHTPILQVRNLDDGIFEIYGETIRYRQHLKRLGGKWNPERRSWQFSAMRIEEVRADPAISSHVWIGIPEHEPERMAAALKQWEQQRLDYGEGYQYGQERRDRIPIGRPFPRHRR